MSETKIYQHLSRLEQRVSNLIRPGVVAEVKNGPPRVKVEYDKDAEGAPVTTGWLCYFEERQGYLQTWNPPKVGEQCVIFSPAGDLRLGKVLLGLNTSTNSPISSDENIHLIKFSDGSTFQFDRSSSSWSISLGSGTATFTGATYTFNANLVFNGNVEHKGNYIQTGNFTSSGTVAGAAVKDSTGTLNSLRTTYNGHTHENGDISPPDQTV